VFRLFNGLLAMIYKRLFFATLPALLLAACGETALQSVEAGTGPNPTLVKPVKALIPTIKVFEATGWPAGKTPVAAPGLQVAAFATGLQHPRWMLVLPNGDVLVAETGKPGTDPGPGGIKGWFAKRLFKKVGAAGPNANRITLLRDTNGDGVADQRSVLIGGLFSPFGMALVADQLFIANADALVAVPFTPGQVRIDAKPRLVARLPAGRNHHWTKSLTPSPDGKRLYVGVGSNSNVGEKGMAEEVARAAVLEIDPATGAQRVFASGLRNPVGLKFNPASGQLWTAVNERDELGSDLVPDYLTSVRDGGFYGWPYSYFGQHVDERVKPARPDLVAKAIKPDYALGPHTSSLGLTFSAGAKLGPRLANGAFIGQHGSWNRNPPSGYRVIFVPFAGAQPSGPPVEVLGGFLVDKKALGRPVGVEIGNDGALLVADDVGGVVWRVTADPAVRTATR
jgi:glucose/arabinose dehydrogenase